MDWPAYCGYITAQLITGLMAIYSFSRTLTLAPVVDVGPEKLAESLEDRLSAATVALLHVTVQRVQTLVASRG